ncbi:hypothetical protein TNCV_1444181 [Trichonephila clavipes]|nr:hypothetical protein TNCV_1444181 [Trichonephila clavipes]
MPPRPNKVKTQQHKEFERGGLSAFRKVIFLSLNTNQCAAEQFHSVVSLEAVNRRAPNNLKNWQWTTEAQHVQLLPWPAYSPDMSPIEHVWNLVCWRLARDSRPAASKDEHFLCIQAIWNSLPQADIQNLFDSMPHHKAALIAARGGYTKYSSHQLWDKCVAGKRRQN